MPIDELVTVAPAVWPGAPLELQPGDLTRFAPMGFGFGGPTVVRPWDDVASVLGRQDYYAFREGGGGPFGDAPTTEPAGGTVYFDADSSREDFVALLRLMHVRTDVTSYAAFLGQAGVPAEERFLTQLRIVSRPGLAAVYGASTDGEAEALVQQRHGAGDALWAFVEDQLERWGTGFSPALQGTMGGDGDWAKESLAFGFTVESSYYAIYRIWSRARLVTK